MNQKHLTRLFVIAAMIVSLLVIGSAAGTLTEGQQIRGDCNGDGAINMKDVLILRKYIADLPVEFADHICSVSPSETQPTAPSYTQPSETQPSYTQPSETQPSYTQPSETQPSYTQPSETQPSETQPSQTQPSQSQPQGDTYTLSLNISEEAPRYNTVTHTDSFQVPKNQDATIEIVVMAYQDLDVNDTAKIKGFVNLTGATLAPVAEPLTNPVIGDIEDHKYPITFTYKVSMDSDKTVSGTIASPIFEASSISVNGQGGTTPTQGSQATTEPGVTHLQPDFLLDPDADTVIDRITLAFYDKACTQYGITFHSYEELKDPVVQYVLGTTDNFASAQSVSASTEVLKGFMAYNYNPADFTFNVTYEERNNCAGTMPEIADYTHKAALPVLSYGQAYSYRVGGTNAKGQQVWSPIYSFKTRPQTTDDFSFIWMSDSQYTPYTVGIQNRFRTVLQAALKLCPNPDMMLHGGDFSDAGNYLWTYATQVTGNEDFFTKYPLMSASGNHDTTGTSEIYRLINVDLKGTGRNASQSTTTGTYYSYDYGNAHFVALNISKDAEIDGTQLEWLKTDLAAASGAKWKFVYFHRPMYTCAGEKEPDPMDDDLCKSLEETFTQYGVDVVVQAHVHMYSRTQPITELGKIATGWTTKTENNYEYTVNPGAPIYTVTATAASNVEHIYRGASGDDTQPAYLAKHASGKANSFAIYHISGNTLSVDACYVDDNGSNLQYYDKFGIIKSAA